VIVAKPNAINGSHRETLIVRTTLGGGERDDRNLQYQSTPADEFGVMGRVRLPSILKFLMEGTIRK
jgi:hypothetical protein